MKLEQGDNTGGEVRLFLGDSLQTLKDFEDNSIDSIATAPIISDLDAGKAGEHLVCAELLLRGYKAFLSDQGLPYDLLFEYKNSLVRVQVKSTRAQRVIGQRQIRSDGYVFNLKRCGKNGVKTYPNHSVDLFALVLLDTFQIGYVPYEQMCRTMIFRSKRHTYTRSIGTYIEELTLERALSYA